MLPESIASAVMEKVRQTQIDKAEQSSGINWIDTPAAGAAVAVAITVAFLCVHSSIHCFHCVQRLAAEDRKKLLLSTRAMNQRKYKISIRCSLFYIELLS